MEERIPENQKKKKREKIIRKEKRKIVRVAIVQQYLVHFWFRFPDRQTGLMCEVFQGESFHAVFSLLRIRSK